MSIKWIEKRATVRDALARLELSGYAAIPVLDANGRYAGTVTEGDLLRKLTLTPNLRLADLEEVRLFEVPLRSRAIPVGIDARVEELAAFVAELRRAGYRGVEVGPFLVMAPP